MSTSSLLHSSFQASTIKDMLLACMNSNFYD
ncbi:hypothetical protein T11_13057 [Trichinella zimbabwensis]|uniref:Uncharacterized protein n=1 Tax=Trichinella zimbabwensis TaxID=268475 RepID=A0A0V1GGC5_9BILA|nr:hypothetical protein T11_13057 [Trichinella zimbabwensis]